jgi:hypothetical protein
MHSRLLCALDDQRSSGGWQERVCGVSEAVHLLLRSRRLFSVEELALVFAEQAEQQWQIGGCVCKAARACQQAL